MSYKITFDEKAKEIIKTVVNNGDTPTPTPTEDTISFRTFTNGIYKFHPDKLLEVLIKKGVDVDTELEDIYYDATGIILALGCPINEGYMSEKNAILRMLFSNSSGNYTYFKFGNYNKDYYDTSSLYFEMDTQSFKGMLDGLAVAYPDGAEVIFDSTNYGGNNVNISYAPIIGIQTGSDDDTKIYNLTNAEFDTILEYIGEYEEQALEL